MTTELAESKPHEVTRMLLQLLGGLAALFAVVYLIGHFYRDELDAIGRAFVARFGHVGVALGVFSSDALTSPIPPQAYVVAALAGKSAPVATFAVGSVATVAAGVVGYQIGRVLPRVPFVGRLLVRTRQRVDAMFERWGAWAILIAVFSPVPYSLLCYLCGMYRMPPRLFAGLLVLRIPRFVVTCLVVQWSLAASS